MNLYLIVFLLLAAGTLAEWFLPRRRTAVYAVCWTVTAAAVCLRFGQGTDYVTYDAVYDTIPAVIDLSQGYICGFYPEVGWRLLCAGFKLFGAPFWALTMAAGLLEMGLLHRFLQKYVPLRTAGLFLSYPVLIFVYMVSGLRQGMAVCIFLGVAVPFYLEKKWVRYVIAVLAAASFHKVGYGWLVLPAACYLPAQIMLILTGASAAVGALIQIPAAEQLLLRLLPSYHMSQFLTEGSVSLFAVGERLVSFGVLILLFGYLKKKRAEIPAQTELLLKGYLCGVCFYMLMFGNSYYASRYAAIFKVLECAVAVGLVLAAVREEQKAARAVAAFFFCLTMVMGCKNLNAAVREGGYDKAGVNVLTYPYVSVFDRERINDYLDYEERKEAMYQYNIGDQQLWMIGR
ncbi:MAG: EpsG family protein [Eubacteriales bacterium]|nr:EpsG family protein [Eubacteriales bacterium]